MSIHSGDRIHGEDPLSLLSRAQTKLYSLWVSCTYPFAAKGRNLSIHHSCLLKRPLARQMKLGNSVIIRKDAWLNIPCEDDGQLKISIGDNCTIGARSSISSKNSIHLERDVITGASVLIQDHNHAYEDISVPIRAQGVTAGGMITIEEGCWIGQGAAIVCSAGSLVIGRNSVVGANAFVNKSCPPHSVIVGNPGRVARRYDPAKNTWIGAGNGRSTSGESEHVDAFAVSAAWARRLNERPPNRSA
jgi:acetyltransferase-like isoleucine patch superfamily enzyme